MAFKVPLTDNETGKVEWYWTVDAREKLQSDPTRYTPGDSGIAEVLARQPKQITQEDLLAGKNLDPVAPPKREDQKREDPKHEAQRPPKPGVSAKRKD